MGNSVETQEKILDAAIIHFAQKGYNGTKTADIARDAGVSEGSVFKYYSTKKDILRGVMEKIVHQIIPDIVIGPGDEFEELLKSGDPAEELKKIVRSRIGKVLKNVNAFRILLNELQYHEDILNEFRDQVILRFFGIVEGAFKEISGKGMFRQVDPHMAARSLLGMMNVIVLENIVLKRPLDIDREIDAVLDLFMNGIIVRNEV
ncbi:MAG TPA: TetR/AcrR family transcriptional regulator [Negativicutes bacterium]|nr:TetR/AcrR family transcriptional regulator [Negativicutes bacterium]